MDNCESPLSETCTRPYDGSVCVVKFLDLRDESNEIKQGIERTITIGESDNIIDRQLELLLVSMTVGKEISCSIEINSKTSNCRIKLISFEEPSFFAYLMVDGEKLSEALRLKNKAACLIKSERYADAHHILKKAFRYVTWVTPAPNPEADDIYTAVVGNMSLCLLKMKRYEHTITLCSKVLNKNSNHVKSLLRSAAAYDALKNPEKAKEALLQALKIEPNNRMAQEQLAQVKVHIRDQKSDYADLVKKMLQVNQ